MRFTCQAPFGGAAEITATVRTTDDPVIREIHARVDIVSFIGQYVQLKKRGRDFVGLCPFHGEKTPSFHVHPDPDNFFKCFGCGAGGDVITFLRRLENVSFGDAKRMLAARAGIEIEPENPRTARQRTEREAIYEANRLAAAFFARTLRESGGARGRAYCEKRGFTQATIEKFSLGYAPDAWDALVTELERNGVDLALAAQAGLVKAGQRGYYDFYRDRLMVPTYATTGEAIAFGGRALGDAEPKYLNTSTTPVYTKGRHLYALNVARRAAQTSRTLIVVEGYLDCIALHQAGLENAVAALGTSFTEEQARELRKYADYVFLCFDGDAAGSSAATKAIDTASHVIEHAGSSVRIVLLPAGEDPDSFLRANGPDAFRALLERSKPAIEYKIDAAVDGLHARFDSPAKIAAQAESLIQGLAPREEWDRWRVYVANRLQVNVDDLRNSRFLARSANFAPRGGAAVASGSRHVKASVEALSFEREVVSVLLEEPKLAAEYGDRIPAARFRNDVYRRIYQGIVDASGTLHGPADVFALFADDDGGHEVLAMLGRGDRSSAVRYADSDERRAHLESVVERLALEDDRRRYGDVQRLVDEYITQGRAVPRELRDELEALDVKLRRKTQKKE
jgi:DNA primase